MWLIGIDTEHDKEESKCQVFGFSIRLFLA